jgi:hypothetical protein
VRLGIYSAVWLAHLAGWAYSVARRAARSCRSGAVAHWADCIARTIEWARRGVRRAACESSCGDLRQRLCLCWPDGGRGSTVGWRGWVAQRWRSVDVAWLEVRSRRRAMSEGMARGGVEAQTREPGQTNEVGKTNEARKRALMTPSQVRRGTRGRAGSPTCSTFAFMVETRQPRPVLHRRSRSAPCATRFLTPCLCFRTGRQRAEEAPECPSEGGRYHQHGRTAP